MQQRLVETLRKSRAEPNLFELCRDAATSRREVRPLITLRKSRAEPNLFELCRDAATSRRNVPKVESRAELVRAIPRCSNVSKKHGTSRRRSAVILRHTRTESRYEEVPVALR